MTSHGDGEPDINERAGHADDAKRTTNHGSEQLRHEYVMSDGLLTVASSVKDIPGWRFGRPPVPAVLDGSRPTLVSLTYRVTDSRIPTAGKLSSAIGPFWPTEDGAVIAATPRLPIVPKGQMRVEALEAESSGPIMSLNPGYERWTRFRLSRRSLPGYHLSNIAIAALLDRGYAPLHSSVVSIDGSSIAMFAPSQVGKTRTALTLVADSGAFFLSDDMAFTDGRTIYGCPLTATHITSRDRRHTFFKRVARNFDKTANSASRVLDLIPEERLQGHAPVGAVVILQRGPIGIRDIKKSEAVARLYNLTQLEFTYMQDQLLHANWLAVGWPDFHNLNAAQTNALTNLVSNASRVVEISVPELEHFPQLVLQILRE